MKTLNFRMKSLAIVLPFAGICYLGCSDNDNDVTGLESPNAQATATVRGYRDSTLRGTVTFREQSDSLLIQGDVSGLVAGSAYAVHVHQFGNCSEPDSSGDHFALPGERHGNPFDTLPLHHLGDLPNLQVDGNGVGHFEIVTNAMTLGADSMSVLGRSVVVHLLPDDYMTQPAGGSDGRIACGVIALVTGNPSDTAAVPMDTVKTDTAKTDTAKVPVPVDTVRPPGY
ncbi:MAG TPA: superoxide dismutase family protein [Fibrobacteria bacterium]|nr:superoxide dismutase family protein [Fibrobacteria bacterium]